MSWSRLRWLLLLLVLLAAGGLAGYVAFHKERLAEDLLQDGRRLVEQGRPHSALGDFTLAIFLTPERHAPYLARAQAYQVMVMPQRAEADLDMAIRLAPQRPELHLLRGRLLADGLGRYLEAIQDFDAALRLDAGNALALYHRGLAYDQLNNSPRAIADYTRALERQPDLLEAWLQRAAAYGRLRQHERVVADLTAALRLRPDAATLYDRRGSAYLALRNFEAARADFDRALAMEDSLHTRFKRGTALVNLRRHRGAIADFTYVLRVNRFSIAARYNRALAFDALGQTARARQDWAIVCELEPGGQSEACLRAQGASGAAPAAR